MQHKGPDATVVGKDVSCGTDVILVQASHTMLFVQGHTVYPFIPQACSLS